jgi:hypothetical protein
MSVVDASVRRRLKPLAIALIVHGKGRDEQRTRCRAAHGRGARDPLTGLQRPEEEFR